MYIYYIVDTHTKKDHKELTISKNAHARFFWEVGMGVGQSKSSSHTAQTGLELTTGQADLPLTSPLPQLHKCWAHMNLPPTMPGPETIVYKSLYSLNLNVKVE